MTSTLNQRQHGLLAEINETGPVGITELALNIGATESATRSAVKRLAARGLVDHTGITYRRNGCLAWFLTEYGDQVVAGELAA